MVTAEKVPAIAAAHLVVSLRRLMVEVAVVEIFDVVIRARLGKRLRHPHLAVGTIDLCMAGGTPAVFDVSRGGTARNADSCRRERVLLLRPANKIGPSRCCFGQRS